MELFSIRNRVYTWTVLINLSIGIAFVATAGAIWNYTQWGTISGISQLAVGMLAVGLLAFLVAFIAMILGIRNMRTSNQVATPEQTEEATMEQKAEQMAPTEAEWKQMRVVEEVIEKWADKLNGMADGTFDYEINKMDKYHYYVNFFNEKNVRVYQLLVAPNKDKSAFDVAVSFIRPDNAVPQVDKSDLEKQLAKHEHIHLALA